MPVSASVIAIPLRIGVIAPFSSCTCASAKFELIRSIEESFANVRYEKFVSINGYDSSVQVIENKTLDFNLMTKEERKNFVPEYLTLSLDDIHLEIL